MTINTELADKIRTLVGMRPDVHDQTTWFYVYGGRRDVVSPEDVHAEQILAEAKKQEDNGVSYMSFEPEISCDATLCVAGWACILEGYTLVERGNDTFAEKGDEEPMLVMAKAGELLGLEDEVANWLFCSTDDDQAIEALDDMVEGNNPVGFRYREDDYCCDECSF